MKKMNIARKYGRKVLAVTAAGSTAVVSSGAFAAIDTAAVTDELTAAGTAAGLIVAAAMAFAAICMAGFALYRRLK